MPAMVYEHWVWLVLSSDDLELLIVLLPSPYWMWLSWEGA